MSKRELEAFLATVTNSGEIIASEPVINLTIRCSLQCAELLEDVQALLGNNKKIAATHGDALKAALEAFLEKNDPLRKAERAEKRAESKKSLQKKAMEKLENGIDLSRGHKQAVGITKRMLEAGEKVHLGPIIINPVKPKASKAKTIPETGKSHPKSKPSHPKRQPLKKALVHEVMLRDGGRCPWVSPEGKRCEGRKNLQIDHKIMVCRGGGNELENLRLFCASHNRLEAERQLEGKEVGWNRDHRSPGKPQHQEAKPRAPMSGFG